jgi:tRNA A-37 threonylcarbamoyl transferase component Bud32
MALRRPYNPRHMASADDLARGRTALPGVAVGRRRLRRPSGETPPLPREEGWRRLVWLGVAVFVVGLILAAAMGSGEPLAADVSILRWAEGIRTTSSVDVAKAIDALASTGFILVVRWATVVALAGVRRFRHLVVALVTWAVVDLVFLTLHETLPAPSDLSPPISVVSGPSVYHFPGAAVVALSVTLFTMIYALVPSGGRNVAGPIGGLILLAVVCSRILLASSYPSAALYGAVVGATVVELVFAWLAPSGAFPVSYRRGGNAAHLDLGGPRGAAVARAMRDQLAIDVVDVVPFGDEGSGGSTPLLMTTADGTRIFGKILATGHVRSDRWYRIARTIMYGKLEDEAPFGTVRRLIEYEDYALRLLDDDGIRVARTYGVVELTPNREYLLPTEFFEGSQTLGHAEVTDAIVDQAMALVRSLWDHGLAHRDVKPANLLVVDGRLQLIDVSGLEVRPSPWRQAVDLANMMLVMSLRSDSERVYEAALRWFSPEEVAEAFASAVGLAIPTELQRHLKEDPRDLVGEFRRLAPTYPKVSIQRWSAQRIGLTLAALAGVILVVVGSVVAIRWGLN